LAKGKVVCLVSGGIDSPVAAWLMIRKGYGSVFVFYDNQPFTDETTRQRAIDVVKKLGEFLPENSAKLYVVPHGEDLADILRNCPRKLTCVLCRRMMYRVGKEIARMEKADAIVTGEIIGEQASQTLRNLRVENSAVNGIPILRPLLGLDKQEVEKIARKIGTFEISIRRALCCSVPPKKPRTFAGIKEVADAEKNLDIDHMVNRDLKGTTIIYIGSSKG
jgi:thiamine biosynthesis protein ThiI